MRHINVYINVCITWSILQSHSKHIIMWLNKLRKFYMESRLKRVGKSRWISIENAPMLVDVNPFQRWHAGNIRTTLTILPSREYSHEILSAWKCLTINRNERKWDGGFVWATADIISGFLIRTHSTCAGSGAPTFSRIERFRRLPRST